VRQWPKETTKGAALDSGTVGAQQPGKAVPGARRRVGLRSLGPGVDFFAPGSWAGAGGQGGGPRGCLHCRGHGRDRRTELSTARRPNALFDISWVDGLRDWGDDKE
jgi:hypothetical protein